MLYMVKALAHDGLQELNAVRADGWDGMGGSFPETVATIRVPAVRISTQGSKKM